MHTYRHNSMQYEFHDEESLLNQVIKSEMNDDVRLAFWERLNVAMLFVLVIGMK